MSKQTFNVMFGIVAVIFVGAWFYSGSIKPQYTSPDEADSQAIVDRIRPLGLAMVTGQESAAMPSPAAGSTQTPAMPEVVDQVQAAAGEAVAQGAEVIDQVQDSAEAMVAEGAELIDKVQESAGAVVAQVKDITAPSKLGQETYAMACLACHTTGIAGSPKLGDAESWAPRIAQGIEVLNQHAIEGFQGNTGMMPAKGGRADLSDEAIAAAVAYMVEESGGN